MRIRKNKEWLLRADKQRLRTERRGKLYTYCYMWLIILIPVFLIWYAYLKFDWFAEFVGTGHIEAKGKITLSLFGFVLLGWLAIQLFKKLFSRNK